MVGSSYGVVGAGVIPSPPNTGGSSTWGDIGGDITNQTDLINYINSLIVEGGSRLINGDYYNIPGTYQYFVWADAYIINGQVYQGYISDTLTLSPADATNNRFDTIVINNNGTISVVEGIANANPVIPLIDTETQLELITVLVSAGTTAPVGVTTDLVYNENTQVVGGEWNTTASDASVNLESIEQAEIGTKSIKFTNASNGANILFTDTTNHIIGNDSKLRFGIFLPSEQNHRFSIKVLDIDGANSVATTFQNGQFGFDSSLVGQWQTIIIPASAFSGIAGIEFNSFAIINERNNSTFFVDNINIQEGVAPVVTILPNYTLAIFGTELQLLKDGVIHSVVTLPSGGGSPELVSKTGLIFEFNENAVYNELDFIGVGDIVLNASTAVKGKYSIGYFNGYIPNINQIENTYADNASMFAGQGGQTLNNIQLVSGSNLKYIYKGTTNGDLTDYDLSVHHYITAGEFDINTLNVASFFYDGTRCWVNIGNVGTLATPTLTLEPQNLSIQADWTPVIGATSYVLEYDTDPLFSAPTQAYSGALISFEITGLTNSTLYYVRVRSQSGTEIPSGWHIQSATPIIGSILFQDNMDSFNGSLWAVNSSSGAWNGAVTGMYQFTEPTAGVGSQAFLGGNNQATPTTGEITVIKFDLIHHGATPCGNFFIRLYGASPVDNVNAVFSVSGASPNMKYHKSGVGNVNSGILASGSWKMVLNGDGTMSYHHWNGSSWDLLDTSIYTDGNRYPIIRLDESGGTTYSVGGVIRINDWRITDYDYATLNP